MGGDNGCGGEREVGGDNAVTLGCDGGGVSLVLTWQPTLQFQQLSEAL